MRNFFIATSLALMVQTVHAQLFDHPANVALVSRGIGYVYNVQSDSADVYIARIEQRLPEHPVVPMMKALKVLWTYIPVVTIDSVFDEFSGHLLEAIRLSARLDGGRQEHPEAIFFEMSARGLLAEYYADDGHYMKALGEAGKAYELIKKGFELSDQIPDFLLTTGVYNYFREKYPEKHPIYKPLLWLFKSGDMELGIRQIRQASEKGILTKVEASIYLAYIYLRYEYQPEKAQIYLWKLVKMYPNNLYIKSKLLESLTPGNDFREVPVSYLRELRASDRPYYRMAGNAFQGLYDEKVSGDPAKAIRFYKAGIRDGEQIPQHGGYYRSLACLGLGRIYAKQGNRSQAEAYLEQALESESEEIKTQAEALLQSLE